MTTQLSVQTIQNLLLRRAIAEDVDWAVPLLFNAGPALFSYVFASSPAQAQAILRQAFLHPQHAFSYEHMQVVEVNGAPAGMFIGYPGTIKQQADEKVHMIMARILPLRRLPKILVNVADFSRIKQAVSPNDYYMLGFGIRPEFQTAGLDSYLLAQAEAQAQQWQCQCICVDVTYCNTYTHQMLAHYGYQTLCSKTTDRFHQITRAGGIHRMAKPIIGQKSAKSS